MRNWTLRIERGTVLRSMIGAEAALIRNGACPNGNYASTMDR